MKRTPFLFGAAIALLIALPALGIADELTRMLPPEPMRDTPRVELGDSPEIAIMVAPQPEAHGGDRSGSDAPDFIAPSLQARHFGAPTDVACVVAASGDDLEVTNLGPDELPPGTRIKWQLPATGERGFFALIGALRAGQTLVAGNVLGEKAGRGETCAARVI